MRSSIDLQAIDALCRLHFSSSFIFLEDMFILCLEEGKTSTRLSKNEETHLEFGAIRVVVVVLGEIYLDLKLEVFKKVSR
jgi:hypothetical protein